jgi:DNA-binding transcriptional LysR family regulator
MFDIRDLEAFLTILDTGSISKAAEEHGLTQSALSQKLKKLETSFGTQLFQRTTRNLVPLAGARTLEPLARDLVKRFEALPEALARTQADLSGKITVGCVAGWFGSLLPELSHKLFKETPNIRLELHVDDTTRLLELLSLGRIDFAILAEPFELSTTLFAEQLLTEDLVIFGKKLPRLKDSNSLDKQALLRCPWVTLSKPDPLVEKFWSQEFSGELFPWQLVRIPVVTDHIGALPRIVAGIEGAVGVLPKQIVQKAAAKGYVELSQTMEHRNSVYLVRREESCMLKRHEIFCRLLKEVVGARNASAQ